MLQNKDITKISELEQEFTRRWCETDFIFRCLNSFSFSCLIKDFSAFKSKGYSFEWVLSILVTLPFIQIGSVNKLSGMIAAKKDVFYRIKNNPSINWRNMLWQFAMRFIKITSENQEDQENNQSSGKIRCLIFDDTTIAKTGKFIEKTSYVWDHVRHKSILGFKLLLMGYWDGVSFIPLDFSLHRERGKNKKKPFGLKLKHYRKQYSKPRELKTSAYERVRETDASKIDIMLQMFKRAIKQKLQIDYVLIDSWFTCEQLIKAVSCAKDSTIHLIGMYKFAKTLFNFRNKERTYSQIRKSLGKPKRNRKTGLYYQQAIVTYKGQQIQLFFSRQGKRGKWKTILTTDMSISFAKMIETYQIRWTIEVFFKESKQLLNLGSCQSNDFDAHIAEQTITMIQHTLLTLRFRYDKYETKGLLFEQVKSQMLQARLNERLWGLFIELLRCLVDLFDEVDEMQLFSAIVRDEEAVNKISQLFLQGQKVAA